MKRAVSVLLIICMAFCAGCGEAKPTVDVEAQLLEADRLFLEGNYEEVILTLETVLEVEPATVRGYLRLSDAYIARGEEDKALELLQRGLEITGDEEIAARIQGMTEVIGGIVQAVGARDSTLLLDEDGNVYWCGERIFDYSFANSSMGLQERVCFPVLEEGLPPLQYVSNGYSSNFCGIAKNGDLYAWGRFADSIADSYDEHNEPVKIMENVVCAIQSDLTMLALKNDGKLYSRGQNTDGILGIGAEFIDEAEFIGTINTGQDYWNYDEWLFVMDAVRDIKLRRLESHDEKGGYNSAYIGLAITNDDQLYGWGCFGKEERDSKIYKNVLNRPQFLIGNVRDAGITGDGQLFIVTTDGKLRYIPVKDILEESKFIDIDIPGSAAASVSCGENHICVLDEAGVLYVSGGNQFGQLGIPEGKDIQGYQNMYQPLGKMRVRQVSAGWYHTCAVLDNGVLLTWGKNENGQLGNGRMGKQLDAPTPMKVLGNIEAVYSGKPISSEGVIYSSKEEWMNVFKPIMENVVFSSGTHAITKAGDLKWLYDGEILMKELVYYYSGYVNAEFYIDKDGCLWGRSSNYSGELGIGERGNPQLGKDEEDYELEYALIMNDVVKCVTGYSNVYWGDGGSVYGIQTIILTQSGDVFHCGADFVERKFILKPRQIASGMRDVDVKDETVYMIGKDNGLYVWGDSNWDFIHNGQAGSSHKMPIKIYENAHKVDADGLLLDLDGNVYEFGMEIFAEVLGKNTREWTPELGVAQEQLICRQVELPGFVKDIDACGGSFFAVLENGDLYAWGDNQNGQLGLGDAGSDENIFEVRLPQ